MAHSYSLQLRVVVSEMDNHLRESRLQAFDGIQVKLLPLFAVNVGLSHYHRIEQNVFFGQYRWQLGTAESCGKKREVVLVSNLDIRGKQFWSSEEQRAHVAVEMRGMNPETDGAVNLGAKFQLHFLRPGFGSDLLGLAPERPGGVEQTGDFVCRGD